MSKLLTKKQITENLHIYINAMCYNIYITTDNQFINLSFDKMKEQLIGGSCCFYCNGKYRTRKWIDENSVDVLGIVTN
jgi:hypothetical protein